MVDARARANERVAVRTIHFYLQREVLPRPPFKGSATRYQRHHLIWLLAIRRLRASERLELTTIRTRLEALSAPELALGLELHFRDDASPHVAELAKRVCEVCGAGASGLGRTCP
jgi:DNA-binding transcriptional MerR regulator